MARSEQEQRSSADVLLARTGGKPLNFPTSALIAVAVMPWTIAFALSPAAAAQLSSVIVHGAQDQPDTAFIQVQAAPVPERLSIADIRVIGGKPAKLSITFPRDALALVETQGLVFLMFRDLPPGVTFSAGIPMKDAWAVSLKNVPNLTLLSPMNVTGRFEIRAMLYRGSSVPPQTSTFLLTLAAEKQSADLQSSAILTSAYTVSPDESAAQAVPQTLPAGKIMIGKQEEDVFIERAEALLKSGDFESARLIFTDLADRGSRRAAFRLAQTFDPEVLASLFVVGLTPDLQKARNWYARAVALGALEGQKRLDQLATSQAR
jgi:hypothetical protein